MPASAIVILERSGRIAKRARSALADRDLPVRIREVRDVESCLAELGSSRFPILVLEDEQEWMEALAAAGGSNVLVLVLAEQADAHRANLLRELGADCVQTRLPSVEKFSQLLKRLVIESQRRLALSTGVNPG